MTTGVIVPGARVRVGLLAAAVLAGAYAGPAKAARLSSAPDRAPKVRSQLLLRTGDAAPVGALVPWGFASLGFLPDGRLTFVGGQDELLAVVEGGKARSLMHLGQMVEGCGPIRGIIYHAVGVDGTIAVFVQCPLAQAILRVDADSGAAAVVVMQDQSPSGLPYLAGVAVDGQGGIVTRLGNGLDYDTIVRLLPGRDPDVLIKTGDPLGAGTLVRLRREPSVAPDGTVAFAALTSLGTEVVAVLPPGGPPRVLLSEPSTAPGDWYAPPFSAALPAINADGVVGVLSGTDGNFTIVRIDAAGNATSVHVGDPAPGERTFEAIDWVYPAVDAAGGVIFGAHLSGRSGLYRFDGTATTVVAEDRIANPSSGLIFVGNGSWPSPLPCPDGAIRFVATDDTGTGLFVWRQGSPQAELYSGDAMDDTARFLWLEDSFGDHLSKGPSLASDGAIFFDAWTTGRYPGLFVREPDGTLAPVAIDGGPAPGGGHYVGQDFEFHSIASGGRLAFVGVAAPDGFYTPYRTLYAGRLGQVQRLLSEGETLPWSAATIESLGPPSRISAGGAIVLPVTMTDGWMFLLAWDGAHWLKLAATADHLPDGNIISKLAAGHPEGPLAPQLTDDGRLVFGVVTVDGGSALYRMTLAGGLAGAKRIVGLNDPVPGGTLTPFQPQAMAADRDGRLAFQAVPSGDTQPSTYLLTPGRAPQRIPGLAPTLPPPPFGDYPPDVALPRLALMAAGGVVHEEKGALGRTLLYALPRPAPRRETAKAFDQVTLVGQFNPSPDGGYFVRGLGPGYGGSPPDWVPSPTRLASDGGHLVVAIEPTSLNDEILVLFDLRLDRHPVRRDQP
jgi:hypothetical protein